MLAWSSLFLQFDLSRPSPSNEACYVLLSLLDSTPCLVLFLVFPFVGVVPIETRHSTGLSGFIFLFFSYACLDFYIPSVWLVTSIPEQWGLLCPAQPLRFNPMFGSVLSVSFCGSSANWNQTQHRFVWFHFSVFWVGVLGLLYPTSLIGHVHPRTMRPIMSCSASPIQPHVWLYS